MQEALDAHRHFRLPSAMTPSSPTRSIHNPSSIFYEWSKRIAHCMRAAVVDKHENPSSRMKLEGEIVRVRKSSAVRKRHRYQQGACLTANAVESTFETSEIPRLMWCGAVQGHAALIAFYASLTFTLL